MTSSLALNLSGVHTHIGAYHILHGVDLQVPQGELDAAQAGPVGDAGHPGHALNYAGEHGLSVGVGA